MPTNTALNKKRHRDAGRHGIHFQIDLLTLFLHQGYKMGVPFELHTEISEEAEKLDDVVFLHQKNGEKKGIYLQAKHKADKFKTISLDQLKTTSGNFSLPKYFWSYWKIRTHSEIERCVLATNVDLNQRALEFFESEQVPDDDSDKCLHLGSSRSYICKLETTNIVAELYDNIITSPGEDVSKVRKQDVYDFLSIFRLYANMPSAEEIRWFLEEDIKKTVPKLSASIVCDEIMRRVETWFTSNKRKPIDLMQAKQIYFSCYSKEFSQSLEKFMSLKFTKTDVLAENVLKLAQVFHIVCNVSLLDILLVYQQLRCVTKTSFLCAKLSDIISCRRTVKAFRDEYYHTLLLVCDSNVHCKSVIRRLKKILAQMNSKKVFLVAPDQVRISKYFGNIKKIILNSKLEDVSLKILLNSRINFQGKEIPLENILKNLEMSQWRQILDRKTLDSLVRTEKIKIGETLNIFPTNDYIPRRLMKPSSPQEISERTLLHSPEKCNVICDIPGTGKTKLLKNLASYAKEKYSEDWIVSVILNESRITKVLSDNNTNFSENLLNNLFRILKISTPLERKIFEEKMKRENEIWVFVDGFNEICPYYKNQVLCLLNFFIRSKSIRKVIVTTRFDGLNALEENLCINVSYCCFLSFDRRIQTDYLTEYWNRSIRKNVDKNKLRTYAESLLSFLSEVIPENDKPFFGVPLNLLWLANNQLDSVRLCLKSNDSAPPFIEGISLSHLCSEFVDFKYKIYKTEKCQCEGNKYITELIDNNKGIFLEICRKLSVAEFFPNITKLAIDDSKTNIALQVGMVEKYGEAVTFIHDIFVEYFAVDFFLRRINVKPEEFFWFLNEVFKRKSVMLLISSMIGAYYDCLTPEIISRLLEYGIDVSCRDERNRNISGSIKYRNKVVDKDDDEGVVVD